MKKRVLAVITGLALAAVCLGGCGAKSEAAGSGTAGTTSEPGAQSAASGYKVAMLVNSSISDGGWGASCYQAMVDAAERSGWEHAVTDNVQTSDYATVMTDYADQGYQLIFAPGNEYTDAVDQVAADYPDVYFCLLNGTLEKDNITSVLPDARQIGYMAGALAGLMTESGRIGFIGGMELDTTKEKLDCYAAGAQKVNPDVQVQSAYAGSFDDSAKGKEIASSMISTYDVDIMFGDASAVDTGAREALADAGSRYGIGQPGDLSSADDKVILCSVVTDNAALVEECMKDVEAGTYGNKTIKGDLSNGCLSTGTFSSLVSQEVKDQYLEYIEQMREGTFIN